MTGIIPLAVWGTLLLVAAEAWVPLPGEYVLNDVIVHTAFEAPRTVDVNQFIASFSGSIVPNPDVPKDQVALCPAWAHSERRILAQYGVDLAAINSKLGEHTIQVTVEASKVQVSDPITPLVALLRLDSAQRGVPSSAPQLFSDTLCRRRQALETAVSGVLASVSTSVRGCDDIFSNDAETSAKATFIRELGIAGKGMAVAQMEQQLGADALAGGLDPNQLQQALDQWNDQVDAAIALKNRSTGDQVRTALQRLKDYWDAAHNGPASNNSPRRQQPPPPLPTASRENVEAWLREHNIDASPDDIAPLQEWLAEQGIDVTGKAAADKAAQQQQQLQQLVERYNLATNAQGSIDGDALAARMADNAAEASRVWNASILVEYAKRVLVYDKWLAEHGDCLRVVDNTGAFENRAPLTAAATVAQSPPEEGETQHPTTAVPRHQPDDGATADATNSSAGTGTIVAMVLVVAGIVVVGAGLAFKTYRSSTTRRRRTGLHSVDNFGSEDDDDEGGDGDSLQHIRQTRSAAAAARTTITHQSQTATPRPATTAPELPLKQAEALHVNTDNDDDTFGELVAATAPATVAPGTLPVGTQPNRNVHFSTPADDV